MEFKVLSNPGNIGESHDHSQSEWLQADESGEHDAPGKGRLKAEVHLESAWSVSGLSETSWGDEGRAMKDTVETDFSKACADDDARASLQSAGFNVGPSGTRSNGVVDASYALSYTRYVSLMVCIDVVPG